MVGCQRQVASRGVSPGVYDLPDVGGYKERYGAVRSVGYQSVSSLQTSLPYCHCRWSLVVGRSMRFEVAANECDFY